VNDLGFHLPGSDRLLDALSAEQDGMRAQTCRPENRERFPAEIVDRLRDIGALTAVLPPQDGGLGWGTCAAGMVALGEGLMRIGAGSLAVGRIYEAHVNAAALIQRFAAPALREAAWSDLRDGHLFALWVAPGGEKLRATRHGEALRLTGRKGVCTAAGIATRAVVTVWDEADDERMVLVDTALLEVEEGVALQLSGMRNTSTKPMQFDLDIGADQFIGTADDYLREPDFSAGAWRTSAVTAGGLRALVEEAIRQLRSRGRHSGPWQAARIGQMLIHARTAAMWTRTVAEHAARPDIAAADLTGIVALARVAVEQACLETIALVQRSLGFASLTLSNPAEAMMRDLAIYLRQPAADEAFAEAAVHFAKTQR
jgi:alkylation response protein AidB-like acyl-CoA dehydrogenase